MHICIYIYIYVSKPVIPENLPYSKHIQGTGYMPVLIRLEICKEGYIKLQLYCILYCIYIYMVYGSQSFGTDKKLQMEDATDSRCIQAPMSALQALQWKETGKTRLSTSKLICMSMEFILYCALI